MIDGQDVAAALAGIRARIDAAAAAAGRDGSAVTLVAISKMQPDDRVDGALAAGHRVFGENRVQEAQGRWQHRRGSHDDVCLHLVGQLQSNKTDDAVALFDVIESLDRRKLAEKLAAALAAQSARTRELLVQVNTGEEPQKAGVFPEDADAFIDDCRHRLKLPVVGVMCIPPQDEAPAPHFALLRMIAERNGLAKLSMGMSGDFEQAVALGATHVRVGSAVFGARPAR